MTTPPALPLDLPESLLAWKRGRQDRVVSRRCDGSVRLILFLPGETLEAAFPSAVEAAAALEARNVPWAVVATGMASLAPKPSSSSKRGAAKRLGRP